MDTDNTGYLLLDSGNGRKLERFGIFVLDRPCAQAVWRQSLSPQEWAQADAIFSRDSRASGWQFRSTWPEFWLCEIAGVRFRLQATDFGHVGVFPEHALGWQKMRSAITALSPSKLNVLNLFAYSGGASLALAQAGCNVCHLDASRKMVDWGRQNAELNHLDGAPIRWIVDDVQKFLQREVRRGRQYDGIVMDPPSFGRGSKQELFQIDQHILDLLSLSRQVLSSQPAFVFFSCHTPGYTPLVLTHLLTQGLPPGNIEAGELTLPASGKTLPVPSGTYAFWQKGK